jgi:3-hydroxyisobutyrate dehydrogenase-like beta-hydroxyacid dehydrogenase
VRIPLVKIAIMGVPMAASSFKASSSRTPFDVNSSWVKTLQVGVKVADSPERPGLDAQLGITTMPAPERVQMALPLRDGVLSEIAQGL